MLPGCSISMKIFTSNAMADNYLEKKMEALQERKAKEQRARQIAWKKRMDAYRKRLEEQKRLELDNDSVTGL